MATGISFNESGEDFSHIFQEENEIRKERERKLKATQFRKKMKEHCRGLNNNESSDDDIIIIDGDDSSNDRKGDRNQTKNNSDQIKKTDDQIENDELLARQLQEEFDQEYAVSLEINEDNNLDEHNLNHENNQTIEITNQDDTLDFNYINTNNGNRYEIRSNPRRPTNRSAVNNFSNEFNFFWSEESQARNNTISNNNRRTRRNVSMIHRAPNATQNIQINQFLQTDRDFTADDYEVISINDKNLLRLDEHIVAKKCLNKQEIKSLPTFSYKNNNFDQEENQCSICYDQFNKDDKLTSLACLHKFHSNCILSWLKESRKCPLCQKDAINGN